MSTTAVRGPLVVRSFDELAGRVAGTWTGGEERSWSGGSSGADGGFGLDSELAQGVWDKARSFYGPLSRCLDLRTSKQQFEFPAFDETSRGRGARWGGVKATWRGRRDNAPLEPNASQPKLAQIVFTPQACVVYSQPFSRDLLGDAPLVAGMLEYAAGMELAYAIVDAMIGGDGIDKPLGVLNAPATIKITRSTPNDVKADDIDAMWSRFWGPSRSGAVWMCGDDTLLKIDKTAAALPAGMYLPQGFGGNATPLLKGRPLLSVEQCPALGSPGDLILVDWSQYAIVSRTVDGRESPSIEVRNVGFGDVIDSAMSEHKYFDTDQVVWRFKIRVDGKPMWTEPVTIANGSWTASPFVALA